jgi:hypothetical protein
MQRCIVSLGVVASMVPAFLHERAIYPCIHERWLRAFFGLPLRGTPLLRGGMEAISPLERNTSRTSRTFADQMCCQQAGGRPQRKRIARRVRGGAQKGFEVQNGLKKSEKARELNDFERAERGKSSEEVLGGFCNGMVTLKR